MASVKKKRAASKMVQLLRSQASSSWKSRDAGQHRRSRQYLDPVFQHTQRHTSSRNADVQITFLIVEKELTAFLVLKKFGCYASPVFAASNNKNFDEGRSA